MSGEHNSVKFDPINFEVAKALNLNFMGGVLSKDRLQFMETIGQFPLFQRSSVFHLIDGVMSGSIEGKAVRCFTYGYVSPHGRAGFSLLNEQDDFFCVILKSEYARYFKTLSARKKIYQIIMDKVLQRSDDDLDRIRMEIQKVDPKIKIQSSGYELLVYKPENLTLEQKIRMIQDAFRIQSAIDNFSP